MKEELYQKIVKEMNKCGVWFCAMNFKIYTTEDFIQEFGDMMPKELQTLLKDNVKRIQFYCDDRILEPKNRNDEKEEINPDTKGTIKPYYEL